MIETARLRLRWAEPRDHRPFAAIMGDPATMALFGPLLDFDAAVAVLQRHRGYRARVGYGFRIVEQRSDGKVIGFCGLKPGAEGTPAEGQVEIGWMLGAAYWGQGYAREAAQASLDWAWAILRPRRVVAITAAANTPSRGLMVRLGMRHLEGMDFDHPRFGADDPLRRCVVYSIERPEPECQGAS